MGYVFGWVEPAFDRCVLVKNRFFAGVEREDLVVPLGALITPNRTYVYQTKLDIRIPLGRRNLRKFELPRSDQYRARCGVLLYRNSKTGDFPTESTTRAHPPRLRNFSGGVECADGLYLAAASGISPIGRVSGDLVQCRLSGRKVVFMGPPVIEKKICILESTSERAQNTSY